MPKLGLWPMSALVMLTGIFLALTTGLTMMVTAIIAATRVVPVGSMAAGAWMPPSEWLLFITGLVTITFSVKRATYTDLWRKPPSAATSTTTSTTTTKGPETPAP